MDEIFRAIEERIGGHVLEKVYILLIFLGTVASAALVALIELTYR